MQSNNRPETPYHSDAIASYDVASRRNPQDYVLVPKSFVNADAPVSVPHEAKGDPEELDTLRGESARVVHKLLQLKSKGSGRKNQKTLKSRSLHGSAFELRPRRGLNGEFSAPQRALKPSKYYISLNNYGTITATGGGLITNVIASSPTSCVDWTYVASMFQDVRTLKITVCYQPVNRYNSTATFLPGLYVCSDWENNTALTTEANAASYIDSMSFCGLSDPWEHSITAPDYPPFSALAPVTAPVDIMWIKLFATGILPVGGTMGKMLIRYDLELVGQT
jgi:hypothetical protein